MRYLLRHARLLNRSMIWALILFAVLGRIILLAYSYPQTSSEEGTMGLIALHIAYKGERPIYFYGQNYMGTSEAYLGALFFRLFGVSLFSLRLGMMVFFVLFFSISYKLSSWLYGKRVALFTLLVLGLGSAVIIAPELRAVGGAVETLVAGSLCFLLAFWLATTARGEGVSSPWRYSVYLLWGLVAGWGLWSHLLVVPFVLTSACLLFACGREFWRKGSFLVLLGLGVGGSLLIIYNLHAPSDQNSLAVFVDIQASTFGHPFPDVSGWELLLKKVIGTVFYTLPMATGVPSLGPHTLTSLPYFGVPEGDAPLYWLLQGCWGAGYVLLAFLSTLSAWRAWFPQWWRHRGGRAAWRTDEYGQNLIAFARLLLILNVWLTLLAYLNSVTAAQRPDSMRYLVGLLIATPAVLWPLFSKRWQAWNWRTIGKSLASAFIICGIVVGTIQGLLTIPQVRDAQRQQSDLIAKLEELQIQNIYSGYWICDNLIFESQEKVICGVINTNGQAITTRYPAYGKILKAVNAQASYVFSVNGAFDAPEFQKTLRAMNSFTLIETSGFIIYIPAKYVGIK